MPVLTFLAQIFFSTLHNKGNASELSLGLKQVHNFFIKDVRNEKLKGRRNWVACFVSQGCANWKNELKKERWKWEEMLRNKKSVFFYLKDKIGRHCCVCVESFSTVTNSLLGKNSKLECSNFEILGHTIQYFWWLWVDISTLNLIGKSHTSHQHLVLVWFVWHVMMMMEWRGGQSESRPRSGSNWIDTSSPHQSWFGLVWTQRWWWWWWWLKGTGVKTEIWLKLDWHKLHALLESYTKPSSGKHLAGS